MRKIKFRAWDKKNKKMYQVGQIDFETNEVWDIGEINWLQNEQHILMQYTGLKDNNDPPKEIYEGDIVQEGKNKGIIKFGHGTFDNNIWGGYYHFIGFYIAFINDKEIDNGLEEQYEECWEVKDNFEGEVIGNIYENKELLNANIST